MTRPITFLSDYGTADEFAGVCRAVIARIAPGAEVIDLTHSIPRHDVRRGAAVLAEALPFAPPGVHLAVVDPGVGSVRRALALRLAEERVLVGPDNGLLSRAAEAFGGVAEAVEISGSPARLEPVSASFHGRDLFAPVAARLALGDDLAGHGEPLDPAELVASRRPEPRIGEDGAVAEVASVDGFGNVALELTVAEAARAGVERGERVSVEANGETIEIPFGRSFAEHPEGGLLLYEDSSGQVALAVNRGSAAEHLGVEAGDEIGLRRR